MNHDLDEHKPDHNKRSSPLSERNNKMKTLRQINRAIIGTVCLGVILAIPGASLNADDRPKNVAVLTANAGVTAVLTPTSDPAVAKVTISGVVQSSLGTWAEGGELLARFPSTPDQPVVINGAGTWTSLDGANGLNLTIAGTATPDPANPAFYNAKYRITFTGGTGAYASATGLAELNEVVMFTFAATATTTWTLKGFVLTPR
jgi:hypothetical protein